MDFSFKKVWGESTAFLRSSRQWHWIDLIVLVILAGTLFGIVQLANEWTGEIRHAVQIDLSPGALPAYAFFSLTRGLIAYAFSLLFTLIYGYWAAKDRVAERVLVPLLDILQSIPVLGFMPGLLLALVAAFPSSNIGLELTAILMIFTGQVWNMTFSFYHSLRSIPLEQREVATLYRFRLWQRFKWVELPFAMMGLVWNSVMSMAGGWFFLMISESFALGKNDYRLPGIGSYMSQAVQQGDIPAMIWAIVMMITMIVILDQLLWRPLVVWAQRFRFEEGGSQENASSWFLNWLRRSKILAVIRGWFAPVQRPRNLPTPPHATVVHAPHPLASGLIRILSFTAFAGLVVVLGVAAWKLVLMFREVTPGEWGNIFLSGVSTLLRVLAATALGTLWALPVGLLIGLSPKLSRVLQPIVQVLAAFPAPMLFPAVVALLRWADIGLNWGSVALMAIGTQWYILFNVIAGAMAVPADLREASRSYRLGPLQRFWKVYLPAVFPYLITGWVNAAGGAWNASIVAEYVPIEGEVLRAYGLGEMISSAAETANFPLLAASVLVMATLVVAFNRMVWQRCYSVAEKRFSLSQ